MNARPVSTRFAALPLLAYLAACAAEPPKPPAPFPAMPAPPPEAARPASELGVIDGVVRTADGRALDGAIVAVVPAGGGGAPVEAASEVTHDGGLFRIAGLGPGKYAITATALGHTGAYVDAFDLAASKVHGGVEVKLGGAGITLSGLVRDTRGQPVQGAIVRAIRLSEVSGDVFLARSDAQGLYRVTVPAAGYLVGAAAPQQEAELVRALEGKDQRVDLTLVRSFALREPPPPEVVAWARGAAAPLATVEAEHGFADMKPIGEIVGSARVVSLGEATHGTREFFQLKHRMLEYLVTERGFDVFAIEASFAEALAVNDYVLHGKGDPAEAIAGMGFWTWDTEEVLAMVRWMRRYNQDPKHPRKLKFYGFDMQSLAGAAQMLSAYLAKVDPRGAAEVARVLGPIDDAYSEANFTSAPPEAQKRTIEGLAALRKRLDRDKADLVKKSGEPAWRLARLAAAAAHQGAVYASQQDDPNQRDRAMAENALSLLALEGPRSKMVIWAHNGHVARSFSEASYEPMGRLLDQALGKDQVIFGFAFDHGSFQSNELPFDKGRGLMTFTVPPAPAGSLDGVLAAAGHPLLALDLRRVKEGSVEADWLRSRTFSRSIGSGYDDANGDGFFASQTVQGQYDALLFVASTTAARARPTVRRGRAETPPAPHAFTNGSFEEVDASGMPTGWWRPAQFPDPGYRVKVIEDRPRDGKRVAVIERAPSPWPNAATAISQRVDAAPYRGKRVRLRAAVRAEVRGPGNEAHLFVRAPRPVKPAAPFARPSRVAAYRNTVEAPIVGKAWETRELEIDVPEDAEVVSLGFALAGRGRAFVDDVSLTVVGEKKP